MINVTGLSIKQGNRILFNELSFELLPGESICICGESGSGKSSLLKALAGFMQVEEGTICIDGLKLGEKQIDEIRRKIAWIPQELSLPTEWVSDMVRIPFALKANRGVPFSEELLMQLFKELGLNDKLYLKRVNEISGGERQRMMLAVSALLEKRVILVDEPTSALDAQSTKLVIQFFQRLCREKQVAVVAVSHDKYFAESCTKTYTI
ncbi:MAG: ABC transporter ATP-binding protein [Phocaeicola sp.]